MVIQEKTLSARHSRESRDTSYETFLHSGDRLYYRHLDARERLNLLDEALNEYARALEQVPDSAEVMYRMARIFIRKGELSKAERCARKALHYSSGERGGRRNRDVVSREAHYVLGYIHYQAGDFKAAMDAYMAAIRHGGLDTSRARLGLAQASMALCQEHKNFMKKAGFALLSAYSLMTLALSAPFEKERTSMGQFLTLLPRVLVAWAFEETGDRQGALERYLGIHRSFPGLANLGIVIGDIYREQGEMEKAACWFERVLAKHPGNLNAHFHLARLQEQREDFEAMAGLYEKLAKLKPGDPHIHCNLANAYYYEQRYDDALVHYESALHLGTNNRWRAMVAQSIGNIQADYLENEDAAIAYYEMAKALDPSEVENYIQLGLLYFQKEDFANAELVYRKALAIAPNNPRLTSNLGYLRWMEGDIENAVNFYEKAVSLDDGYEIPLNNLGVIYLDTLGQVQKAIELFKRSVGINENYALGYYNLGRAYSFLDDRLEAANCFQIARNLNRFSRDLDNDELVERINSLFETCEQESRE
jgi:tetratricopeptide (TPR) repeat protein